MRGRGIVPILVLSILFLTAGVALATPYYFINWDGVTVGATVDVVVTPPAEEGGLYKYTYEIYNNAFTPVAPKPPDLLGTVHPISEFDLPIAEPIFDYGWGDGSSPLVRDDNIVYDVGGGWMFFYFLGAEIEQYGTSPKFSILSTNKPEEGEAILWDGGTTINANVESNLDVPGDGGATDTVPEPGTLFLVGGGLFGLGCLRLLRSTRKSNS